MKYFLFLSIIFLQNCGVIRKDSETIPAQVVDSNYRGFVFRADSPGPGTKRSSLYFYDFRKGELKKISSDESSDFLLYVHDQKLFIFNRVSGESNVSYFDLAQENWPRSKQQAIAGITMYDPSSASSIGKNLALSLNFSGKFWLYNFDQNKVTREFVVPKNLLKEQLRPGLSFTAQNKLVLLHQGFDGGLQADGTQQAFIFDHEQSNMTGHIPLNFSNPLFSQPIDDHTIEVMSPCAAAMLNCKGGIERLDINKKEAKVVWDFKDKPYFNNGPIVSTKNGYLASLMNRNGSKQYIAKVENGKVEPFYEFGSGLWYSLLLHYKKDNLTILGETNVLKFFKGDVLSFKVDLPETPREGIFIP